MEPVPVPDDPAWVPALGRVLDDPTAVAIHLQPIVDLQHATVTGYEALARFAGEPATSPDRWFRAAAAHGCDTRLAAVTLDRALARRAELPANTFLTVNLEPGHAVDPGVRAVLDACGRLDRVIVEVTEHTAPDDVTALRRELDALRELGARTAIDDAGAGYAGLHALLELRPDLIKLDRSLISGLDQDPARRVLVHAVGELADSIDAWILGEGIETDGELGELVALGVPLGQGYRLGRPGPDPVTTLEPATVALLEERRWRRQLETVAASIAVPASSAPAADRIVCDELGRPVQLVRADGTRTSTLLVVKASEPLTAIARRIAARADRGWADPVALTDGSGRLAGVIELPRLLEALAAETG